MMTDESDPRIRQLLEYLAATLLELAENPKLPVIRITIEGMERLGNGDDASSRLIRKYALELKGEVFRKLGRCDEAIVALAAARELSDKAQPSLWVDTGEILELLRLQGKAREALDLIGRTIMESLEHGLVGARWKDCLKLLSACPLDEAMASDTFRKAISCYADRVLTIPGNELLHLLSGTPQKALEVMANAIAGDETQRGL